MAGNLVQGAVFTVMVVRAGMLRDPAFEPELLEEALVALEHPVERTERRVVQLQRQIDRHTQLQLELIERESEFAEARDILGRHTLTLIGVQNASPAQLQAAAGAGLASFAPNAPQPSRRPSREPAASAPPIATAAIKTRLVTQPVRSGTQIYARGADLVVTAAVSPGAEIIADGNIHVYGALRGRALAGAGGDADARIFCSRLEAELVSIAGHYLVSEQLPAEQLGFPVQIALVDDRLTVTRN